MSSQDVQIGSTQHSGKLLFVGYNTVGMGLAPSVGEAALEPGLNIRKLGEFAYSTVFFSAERTKCRFADGRSKPLPYGDVCNVCPTNNNLSNY